MKKNIIGLLFILAALIGAAGEYYGMLFPTISWPFTMSRRMPLFQCDGSFIPQLSINGVFHWFGWLFMAILLLIGVIILLRRSDSFRLSPEYAKRLQRFRALKRGYLSMWLLLLLVALAGMDHALVGKRALAVHYEGEWYFPAFTRSVMPGSVFGLTGDDAQKETDYRALAEREGLPGAPDWVIMPLVPYEPTADVAQFPTEALEMRDGRAYVHGAKKPYNGLACRLYEDGQMHMRVRFRKGLPDGHAQGWDRNRREVYMGTYRAGVAEKEHYNGEGTLAEFLSHSSPSEPYRVLYHPVPPMTGGHILGTTSQGLDILAYLFGGLQVNIKACLLYLPIIYSIGLTMGMLMGYFGGKLDLLVQRFIEILSQLPFLFVVMIVSDMVPREMRGMVLILGLLAIFGWMHMTYIIRTATMREKTRDYVAAARIMGAGPMHIMLRHILPNLTGIVVTLVPFSVAALVLSLTSLDYMGYGLPETYAGWGRLLNDGLSKLSSPWLVSSAFVALVFTLLLVTFIGEAVREAYDPRRRTFYE